LPTQSASWLEDRVARRFGLLLQRDHGGQERVRDRRVAPVEDAAVGEDVAVVEVAVVDRDREQGEPLACLLEAALARRRRRDGDLKGRVAPQHLRPGRRTGGARRRAAVGEEQEPALRIRRERREHVVGRPCSERLRQRDLVPQRLRDRLEPDRI